MGQPEKQSGVHVIDQSGQSYGSERRCCNRCGLAAFPGMVYVTTLRAWDQVRDADASMTCS